MGYFAAFVELHIEQGPLLERAGIPIGVVTAIAAPASLADHLARRGRTRRRVLMPAGAMPSAPPPKRCWPSRPSPDPSGSPDTVATTGVCRVHPGAINSIPDRVTLEIDVRDIDLARRDEVLGADSRGDRSDRRAPAGRRCRRMP